MTDGVSIDRRLVLKGAAVLAGAGLNATVLAAALTAGRRSDGDVAATSRRLAGGWAYLQGTMGGIWEIWHSEETAVWRGVSIPHSFNAYDACDPDTPYYRGNGWYRTRIAIANPYPNGRTLLHFEGAGQTTTVHVGDEAIGTHVGGYGEFAFDITDAVRAQTSSDGRTGTHPATPVRIAVRCDNSRDLERLPGDLSDFSVYGGLYRHVNLVYVPAVSLERVHIETRLATPTSAAEIAVRTTVYAPHAASVPVHIRIVVMDPHGRILHRADSALDPSTSSTLTETLAITRPMLWCPREPHLYRCIVTVSGDGGDQVVEEHFGIKHTEFVEHGPFKLNGERLLLRGTHRHEDHSGCANAMSDDLIEEEMRLIKALGANFIRLGHYQQSRRVLDLCDRLGILVWEEIPWCRSGVGGDIFKATARSMLRDMIGQHYNHASILFWGLGNEDDWPTEYPGVDEHDIRAFMQELNDIAHRLDPSRYTSFRRCDFARDIPDVYSPSIWAGWYRGTYAEYQKALETERWRVKHLIHIEWGADSHAGRHAEAPDRGLGTVAQGAGTDERGLDYLSTGGAARVSRDGDWSETYACDLFDWHLKVQETLPWFVGSAQWVFKDFTTPLRVENPVPRINQKGLIQRDMARKEGYYVFQSYWADEPMVHIYGHGWPTRWGDAGEARLVKVYSNCDEAELYINGASAGTMRRDSQDFPAAGLRWTIPFATGANRLHVVARRGTTTVTDSIEFFYETVKWGSPATLSLAEIARGSINGHETITIEAKLHDIDGRLCLDAKDPIRFGLAGPGRLVDNLGTSSGSRQVELYNGRAVITVMRNGAANTAAVVSQGRQTAMLALA